MSQVIKILRLEALVVFAAVFIAYAQLDYSWWWFVLLLVPDAFMAGYLKSNKIGALAYNIGHTYLMPAALGLLGFVFSAEFMYALALVWAAHVAMDRTLGYGLKLSNFQETHLGHIGKKL